jgi:hypothetical protein
MNYFRLATGDWRLAMRGWAIEWSAMRDPKLVNLRL